MKVRGWPEVIYCEGVLTQADPVYLASLAWSGHPQIENPAPVYYRCARCSAVVSVVQTATAQQYPQVAA